MRLIETTDPEGWANSRSAQSRFPHLVKNLICAVIEPDKLRFPSGDAVWVHGFADRFVRMPKNLPAWRFRKVLTPSESLCR